MRFFALLARASRGRSKLFVSLQLGLQIRDEPPCVTTHETSIPIHGMTAVHNLKIRAFDNIFMSSNTSSCQRKGAICDWRKKNPEAFRLGLKKKNLFIYSICQAVRDNNGTVENMSLTY